MQANTACKCYICSTNAVLCKNDTFSWVIWRGYCNAVIAKIPNLYLPTVSHSPPTLSITTPSPPSQTFLTDPPLHHTLTTRDTFFLILCVSTVIFKPSYSPAHPAGISFCNFTGFLPFFRLLTSTTTNIQAHPVRFSFCFFTGLLSIFYCLSPKKCLV